MTRQEILNKFTSDTIGDNGLLNPKQSERFIKDFIETAEFLGFVDVQPKSERSGIFYHIDMANPATVAAVEGTEYSDETGSVTHSKWDFNMKKRRTQFEMTWEDGAWTIEGGNYLTTIKDIWLQRWGVDTEILATLGDEDLYVAPATPMEKLIDINDGFFTQLTAENGCNILDASGLTDTFPTHTMFASAWNLIPQRYRRFARGNYRWITSTRVCTDYRNWLASRQTGLGDAVLQGQVNLSPQGIPILNANGADGLGVVPEDLGVGENESMIILGDPKNFVWLPHREFKLMNRYIQEKDSFRWTGYAYDDFVVTNFPTFVKITGVTQNPDF